MAAVGIYIGAILGVVFATSLVTAVVVVTVVRRKQRKTLQRDAITRRENIIQHGFGISQPSAVKTSVYKPSTHGWGNLTSSNDLQLLHPARRATPEEASLQHTSAATTPKVPPAGQLISKPDIPLKSGRRPVLARILEHPRSVHINSENADRIAEITGLKLEQNEAANLAMSRPNSEPRLGLGRSLTQTKLTVTQPTTIAVPKKVFMKRSNDSFTRSLDIEPRATVHAPLLRSSLFKAVSSVDHGGFKSMSNMGSAHSSILVVSPPLNDAAQEFQHRNPDAGLGIHIRERQRALNETLYGDRSQSSARQNSTDADRADTAQTQSQLSRKPATASQRPSQGPSQSPFHRSTFGVLSADPDGLPTIEKAAGVSFRRISSGSDQGTGEIRVLGSPRRGLQPRSVSDTGSPAERQSLTADDPAHTKQQRAATQPNLFGGLVHTGTKGSRHAISSEQLSATRGIIVGHRHHMRQSSIMTATGQKIPITTEPQYAAYSEWVNEPIGLNSIRQNSDSRRTVPSDGAVTGYRSRASSLRPDKEWQATEERASPTPSSPTLSIAQCIYEESDHESRAIPVQMLPSSDYNSHQVTRSTFEQEQNMPPTSRFPFEPSTAPGAADPSTQLKGNGGSSAGFRPRGTSTIQTQLPKSDSTSKADEPELSASRYATRQTLRLRSNPAERKMTLSTGIASPKRRPLPIKVLPESAMTPASPMAFPPSLVPTDSKPALRAFDINDSSAEARATRDSDLITAINRLRRMNSEAMRAVDDVDSPRKHMSILDGDPEIYTGGLQLFHSLEEKENDPQSWNGMPRD